MTNNNISISIYSGLIGWYTAANRNYEGVAYLHDVLAAIDNAGSWDEDVQVDGLNDPVMAADLLYSLAEEFELDTKQYETPEDLQNAIDEKIAYEDAREAYKAAFKIQMLRERQVKEDSKRGLYIREHVLKLEEAESKVRQLAKQGHKHGFVGTSIFRARTEVREEME